MDIGPIVSFLPKGEDSPTERIWQALYSRGMTLEACVTEILVVDPNAKIDVPALTRLIQDPVRISGAPRKYVKELAQVLDVGTDWFLKGANRPPNIGPLIQAKAKMLAEHIVMLYMLTGHALVDWDYGDVRQRLREGCRFKRRLYLCMHLRGIDTLGELGIRSADVSLRIKKRLARKLNVSEKWLIRGERAGEDIFQEHLAGFVSPARSGYLDVSFKLTTAEFTSMKWTIAERLNDIEAGWQKETTYLLDPLHTVCRSIEIVLAEIEDYYFDFKNPGRSVGDRIGYQDEFREIALSEDLY